MIGCMQTGASGDCRLDQRSAVAITSRSSVCGTLHVFDVGRFAAGMGSTPCCWRGVESKGVGEVA